MSIYSRINKFCGWTKAKSCKLFYEIFLFMKKNSSLPSPSRISYWWNFGSLLGLCLISQLITGLFLAIQFTADSSYSFIRVARIAQDVNFGWSLRRLHTNGARIFFICLYLHLGRGIYYESYSLTYTWIRGVTILLLVIASAFLGYVLPWGQISFWGARVITGLIQAVPYLGPDIIKWLWGGFSVERPTLTRFFSLHFLIPFGVAALAAGHMLILHHSGSRNPLGLSSNVDKIEFHLKFSFKDLLGIVLFLILFVSIAFLFPWDLGDPENFNIANPIVAPVHIQPEWYFLFAYSILRAIPNKLGGVLALVLSVIVLYLFPLMPFKECRRSGLNWGHKPVFWILVSLVFLLTWIGARPVEEPYFITGQFLTSFYFLLFIIWSRLPRIIYL